MEEKIISQIRGDISIASEIAKQVLVELKKTPILLLEGEIGTGKTSFSKLLLEHKAYKNPVTSPTFNIINEYLLDDGSKIYHFDLYRIKHPAELEEIGFSDYIESGSPCIIEWPEIASEYFDMPHLLLQIEHDDLVRNYTLSKFN